MTHRISHFTTVLVLTGLAVLLCGLQTLVPATGARALTGTGHGPGYLSSDGWWLGTYRLDDGAQGFCLNAGKPSPTGHTLDYADGASLGWFTPEQAAQLAYISREWAGTDDRVTAAAGQIATWLVAGLGGHSPESVAARAGADAGAVLARAHEMAAEAAARGSTGVRAEALVELAESGPGRVRVEVVVQRPAGDELLSPGAHTAVVTLSGAVFPDGTSTAAVQTGTDVLITPTGTDAEVAVTANAELSGLPYGDGLRVAVPRDDAQALLAAVPASATAGAGASTSGPSPLPFQPTVATRTSQAHAVPGAEISDHLVIGVAQGEGLLPTWGVRTADGGLAPVEAVVESRLLGPFPAPIQRSETIPDGAPEVCAVETIVDGTGEYETPSCVLPAAGYYVWVESIDPGRLAPGAGGERLLPWQSPFGVAEEITQAVAPEIAVGPAAPTATARLADTGSAALPVAAGWCGAAVLAAGTALTCCAAAIRRRRAAASR